MKELLEKCGAYKQHEEKINLPKDYHGRYLVNDYFNDWIISPHRPFWVGLTDLLIKPN